LSSGYQSLAHEVNTQVSISTKSLYCLPERLQVRTIHNQRTIMTPQEMGQKTILRQVSHNRSLTDQRLDRFGRKDGGDFLGSDGAMETVWKQDDIRLTKALQ
jgi:hypothetical protein